MLSYQIMQNYTENPVNITQDVVNIMPSYYIRIINRQHENQNTDGDKTESGDSISENTEEESEETNNATNEEGGSQEQDQVEEQTSQSSSSRELSELQSNCRINQVLVVNSTENDINVNIWLNTINGATIEVPRVVLLYMNVLVEAKSTLSVSAIRQFILPYNSWLSMGTVEAVEVGTVNALVSYALTQEVTSDIMDTVSETGSEAGDFSDDKS